jgi:hypothetical protein
MEFRSNVRPLQATPTPYFTLPISNNAATCEPLTGITASGTCFLHDACKWIFKQASTTAVNIQQLHTHREKMFSIQNDRDNE